RGIHSFYHAATHRPTPKPTLFPYTTLGHLRIDPDGGECVDAKKRRTARDGHSFPRCKLCDDSADRRRYGEAGLDLAALLERFDQIVGHARKAHALARALEQVRGARALELFDGEILLLGCDPVRHV